MTTSAETHKAIGTKRSIVSAVRVVFSTSSFSSLDPIIVAMGELPLSLFSIVSLSLSQSFGSWWAALCSEEEV
jgi:hypothetical protein